MTASNNSRRVKSSMAACTIVSRNYLSHARILAESFARHEPDGRFYLLVVDRLPAGVELPGYIELVAPEDLELPQFYEMCFKYDVTELSTAVKPAMLHHLLCVRGESRVAYFDPDVLIARPLVELRRTLGRAGIVLVPHLLDQIPLDGHRPNEQDILIAGSYNLGFIAVRRHDESLQLLDWWGERLRDLCRVSPSEGLMTDQRWIDLVPGLFPSAAVLRDDTYDVAYWNLHSRALDRRTDGTYLINGRPLAFFHFSGFNPTRPTDFSKHQDRFTVAEHPALAQLLAEYAELHDLHDHATSCAWEYGYSRFSNGIAVHPVLRQLYLGLDEPSRARFGDPFADDGSSSFLRWATEPRGERLSLFLSSIYMLRYDLAAAFPDVDGRDRDAFLTWAQSQGAQEERYDPRLVRADGNGQVIDLQSVPLQPGSGGHRPPQSELAASVSARAAAAPTRPGHPLDASGMNVIAYLRSESGLGAAARGYVRALSSARIATSLIDISHLTVNRTEDPTIRATDDEWRYGVNLVVVNADEHFRVAEELGEDNFRTRYNIGVWAWELPSFPAEWHDRFPWYDEVWVGTSFIASALAKVAPMPVVVVPPVLSVDRRGTRSRGRKLIGADPEEFVFTFIFDFHSFFERKNPLAVIDAFTRAFTSRDQARLVIKCVNAHADEAAMAEMTARTKGHRVDIRAGYWPARDVVDLLAGCDAYVSLHRSEGTGITISDAMAHSKPVIATGWSGNTDFMNGANSYPVDYELTQLARDVGPYLAGQTWADPSTEHAAKLMRHVFENRREARAKARRGKLDIEEHFSATSVGEVIDARMAVIAGRCAASVDGRSRFRPPATKGYPGYVALVERLGLAIQTNTPEGATIAIVSRGDHQLLELDSRHAWHFPRAGDGTYAGYYPADSEAAVSHLEQLKANGASYLVIPASSGWWLDHYDGLREHLESRYETLFDEPDTGTIVRLARPRRADLSARVARLEQELADPRGGPHGRGVLTDAWSSAMAEPISAALGSLRREAEADAAAAAERLEQLERTAATLDRRLKSTLAWFGTSGESLPSELSTLRRALAEQRDRTARLELQSIGLAHELSLLRKRARGGGPNGATLVVKRAKEPINGADPDR